MNSRPSPQAATTPKDPSVTTLIALVVLFVAGIACYSNAFSGPFIFDDLPSILQNPTLQDWHRALAPPSGGSTVSGRPVLNLSFALNWALSGRAVWSYHALNLLIHLSAALCLFGLVRRTLMRSVGGPATWLALAVALLWEVHPLQTESVTYVVQRAESLMGLFYLLTLYSFVRAAEGGRPAWFVGSFLACLLGMGTKEVMVSAPVMVLLYDRTFVARSFHEAWSRRWKVHVALGATWLPLGYLVIRGAGRGGTSGFGVGPGFWAYAATQGEAVVHYLRLVVWPSPLILDYGVRWTHSVADVAPYAVCVCALIAATAVAWVKKPALGFLGTAFFAILAPSSLIPGGRQTLAEHRMYLALAPVLVVVVLGLWKLGGRRMVFALSALGALALGWATYARNADYASDLGIWRDTVAERPGNAFARNNYGNLLDQAGQTPEAVAEYQAAVRVDPDYAEAYFNEAAALRKLRRPSEAIAAYEEVIRIHPGDVEAHDLLGRLLAEEQKLPEAIDQYQAALQANPALREVHNDLGNALQASGQQAAAISEYAEALRLDPNFVEAHNNLGNAYREADRQPEAIAQFRAALALQPESPEIHSNLAVSLLISGRVDEGIAELKEALRLNPNLAQAQLNLAIALANTGHPDEAQEHFEAARRLGARIPNPSQ